MYYGDFLLFLLIYLIWHLSYRTYQNCRGKNIFKKVKWIAERSPYKSVGYFRNENLLHYIKECTSYSVKGININKIDFTIPEEYQINYSNNTELSYASEILEMFRKYVIESFFNETKESLSKKHKQLYKMTNETYFMYALYCYLRDCVKNDINPLNGFERVCYKLYLIAFKSCENSDNAKCLIEQSEISYIINYLNKRKE